MNNNNKEDDYRSLLLLDEISKDESITQRDMSQKLGVALGLINSYIKNLAGKGYITISQIPRKRYKYYLTPTGFAEKTRLTYHHLHNFTSLYRVARRDFSQLFKHLKDTGVESIAFCGVDEIAEIAFLSLKGVEIELKGVFDNDKAGSDFFGYVVKPISEAGALGEELMVITSFTGGDAVTQELISSGLREDKLIDISSGGWLKKLQG